MERGGTQLVGDVLDHTEHSVVEIHRSLASHPVETHFRRPLDPLNVIELGAVVVLLLAAHS